MRVGLLLVAIIIAVGCTKVHVPNTPEGMRCIRECSAIRSTCNIPCGVDNVCRLGCQADEKNCHRTCPGATED